MYRHQPPQMLELADGIVCRPRCLRSLTPQHANTDVRLLDHGHIVRTVANRLASAHTTAM